MIEIIPAIDIIGGRSVRLCQGDYEKKTEYDVTPLEMVRRHREAGIGRVHLVDLDGAKAGHPCNLEILHKIADTEDIDIEWGGGIKDDSGLEAVFKAGAKYAVIGSVAVRNPDLMERWLATYGGSRIILGADVRGENVSVCGWTEDTQMTIDLLLERFVPYGLSECIVTDISKDGMLNGPNFKLYEELSSRWPNVTFTVSGGISSMDDIKKLNDLGLPRVIVGKAIYENEITLREISSYLNDYAGKKNNTMS